MRFRDSLKTNVLLPSINAGGNTLRTEGEVLKTNEKSSTCTVRYKDQKNKVVTKSNVYVKLSSSYLVDWFPVEGDLVMIEIVNEIPVITGESIRTAKRNNHSKTFLESDIYTDNMGSETMGGFIY